MNTTITGWKAWLIVIPVFTIMGCCFLLPVLVYGGLFYAIVHFIHKFW